MRETEKVRVEETERDRVPPGYVPYAVFETMVTRYERYLRSTIFALMALGIVFVAALIAVGLN